MIQAVEHLNTTYHTSPLFLFSTSKVQHCQELFLLAKIILQMKNGAV